MICTTHTHTHTHVNFCKKCEVKNRKTVKNM